MDQLLPYGEEEWISVFFTGRNCRMTGTWSKSQVSVGNFKCSLGSGRIGNHGVKASINNKIDDGTHKPYISHFPINVFFCGTWSIPVVTFFFVEHGLYHLVLFVQELGYYCISCAVYVKLLLCGL